MLAAGWPTTTKDAHQHHLLASIPRLPQLFVFFHLLPTCHCAITLKKQVRVCPPVLTGMFASVPQNTPSCQGAYHGLVPTSTSQCSTCLPFSLPCHTPDTDSGSHHHSPWPRILPSLQRSRERAVIASRVQRLSYIRLVRHSIVSRLHREDDVMIYTTPVDHHTICCVFVFSPFAFTTHGTVS